MVRIATVEDTGGMAEALCRTWRTAFTDILKDDFPVTIDTARYARIFADNIAGAREDVFVHPSGPEPQAGAANNAFHEKQGCVADRGEPIAIGAFEYEGVIYQAAP